MNLFSQKLHCIKSIVSFGLFLTITQNICPMPKIMRQTSSMTKTQAKDITTSLIPREDRTSSRSRGEHQPSKSRSTPELGSSSSKTEKSHSTASALFGSKPSKSPNKDKKTSKGLGLGLSKSLPNLGKSSEKETKGRSSKSMSSLSKSSKSSSKDLKQTPVKMADLKPVAAIRQDAAKLKNLHEDMQQHRNNVDAAQKKHDSLSKNNNGVTKESIESDTMKLLKEKMDLGVKNSTLEKNRKSFLDESGNVKKEHQTEHATITKTIDANKVTIAQHAESIKQANGLRGKFIAAENELKTAKTALNNSTEKYQTANAAFSEQTKAEGKKLAEVKTRLAKKLELMKKDPHYDDINDLLKSKKNMGKQEFEKTADAERLKKLTSTPEGKRIGNTIEKLRIVKKQEKQLAQITAQANPSTKDVETQKMLARVKSGEMHQ